MAITITCLWFMSLCLMSQRVHSKTDFECHRQRTRAGIVMIHSHGNTRSSIQCSIMCSTRNQARDQSQLCVAYSYEGSLLMCSLYSDSLGSTALETTAYCCRVPGAWLPWTQWETFTVTSGLGWRQRSRTCDLDSHGPFTGPCKGSHFVNQTCLNKDCTPMPRTCTEWKDRGFEDTSEMDIYPDGPEEHSTLGPVAVTCDMNGQNGAGVTIMGHQHQQRTYVSDYEGPGEYELELGYDLTMEQMVSVIKQSEQCRQAVSWECRHSKMHNSYGETVTGWINRHKEKADYFGGAQKGSHGCDCGTRRRCATKAYPCNCDNNDYDLRDDTGYITVMEDLPMFAFFAGDTGSSFEWGYHTIGPLECWGHPST